VTRLRPPGLLELEHLLAEHLNNQGGRHDGSKRGKVRIDFADLEDSSGSIRHMVRDPLTTATERWA